MTHVKTVSVIGSTGSVGKNTVDLLSANQNQFRTKSLCAGKNVDLLIEQAKLLKPDFVAIADETLYQSLQDGLAGTGIQCGAGRMAVLETASISADISIAAIVGFAGLEPVIEAIKNCKTVAIANKEPLVAAGPLVLDLAKHYGTKILPIDSEHSAIFQCLEQHNKSQISRLILTASGGPFLNWPIDQMKSASIEQALAHPNWRMGSKISIDSATMMNKALEIIEAHYLFDMPADKIDVIIHPQSIIHSMVEYNDGSVLAQLGAPDMRTPIAYALAHPDRMATTGERLNLEKLSALTFEKPDFQKFPALQLAYDCLKAGLSQQIAFNAANEVAVQKFLNGDIQFGDIIRIVESGLLICPSPHPDDIEDVMKLDTEIRLKLT
jgi:1-deoxy-D-xylulose-5-phosphate reductoisomerase